jgi:hypothetical protein
MQRKSFDRMISWIGLTLTVLLIVSGSLLTWAHNFVGDQVKTQLAQQQIFFPKAGDESIAAPEYAEMKQYAGQQLTTGAQAQVYADVFIANHLKAIGGGKTYSQLSHEAQAAPDDAELAGKVATVFRGETLRGLLLNAYAFGTMGTIAGIAALAAFIGAGIMLLLSGLGLWHGSRVQEEQRVFDGHHEKVTPATV